MLQVLPHQLPWWITGPGVGLCVVALYALANVKLGVSGGWLQVVELAETGKTTEGWRLWFNGGLVVGAVMAGVLGTGVGLHGYGVLSGLLGHYAVVPVLLLVGMLIGYGARWAGGCTSGHGISGCAAASPDSLAATATFFSVAVIVTLLLHLVTGGAL